MPWGSSSRGDAPAWREHPGGNTAQQISCWHLVADDKFRETEPAALQGKRIVDTRGFWQ
jgi:hypothetical protein